MKKLLHSKIIFSVNRQSGQVVLITVLMFLFISLSIILGFGSSAVKNFKNTQDFFKSKQSYYAAESGIEDAVYRLSSGKPTTASMNLSVNGADTVTTTTNIGSGKDIISIGDLTGLQRKVKTHFSPEATGVSYSYGVQVGNNGMIFANNSGVVGNVYVNGDITGGSGDISGTAVAVNKVPMNIEQQNIMPVSPPSTITFGTAAASQDFTQSFSPSTTTVINEVAFFIKRTSTAPAGAVTVNIMNDNSGVPGPTVIATGTFDSSFTTSYVWNNVTLTTHPTLTKDATYWIVIDIAGSTFNASRYYTLGANTNGYTRGVGRRGSYGGTWLASAGTDAYFRVCMGGVGSTITNIAIGGNAIAHTITGGSVAGSKYCHIGTGCLATTTDPVAKDFAITPTMIAGWESDALAGGEMSGVITGGDLTLGLKKINGNLTISGGDILTVSGALWITGNFTAGNGAEIQLDPAFADGSGVIIVDGLIDISQNVIFRGSGTAGSYILLLTNSTSANAVTIAQNAGAVLLEAPNGTITFQQNSGAKEASANKIVLEENAEVTYELGVADTLFTSGPGGGGGISGWRETQ
jgi:hypothetical protein